MNAVLQDLRYAVRALRRSSGFATAVTATLALGLGANIAITSLVYGILLRPLPYQEPQRIVQLTWLFRADENNALSTTQYAFWKAHNQSFERFAGYARTGAGVNIVVGTQPLYLPAELISAELLPLLGVRPAVGRNFTPDEDQQGGQDVVLIGHHLWRMHFGGDPSVVGRAILINGTPHVVVGIMPRDFHFGTPSADVWLPLRLVANPSDQGHNTPTLARLKPGVTRAAAQAEMDQLLTVFRREFPGHTSPDERGILLRPYRDMLIADVRTTLLLLWGAVGFVLVIGAANCTALFLGRLVAREHEFTLRAALGASQIALVRPLLLESLVLSFAGGVLGLLLARWSRDAVLALSPQDLPLVESVRLDFPILVITLILSVMIGIAVAAVPVIKLAKADLSRALRSGDRAANGIRPRLRKVIVSAQLALSMTLLAGAGLLMLSLRQLLNTPLGVHPESVWAIQASLPPEKYKTAEQIDRFQQSLTDRLAALPGVRAVATTSSLPLERGLNYWIQVAEGDQRVGRVVEYRAVSPGYFEALGVGVLQGRGFSPTDQRNSPRVVAVNQSLARTMWKNRSALGGAVWFQGTPAEVVGVVSDVREMGLDKPSPEIVYVPASQLPDGLALSLNRSFLTSWLIKTSVPISSETARRIVAEMDATQPVASVRSLNDVMAASVAPRRFVALLLNIFAAFALILAAVGVYGVISYSVERRKGEIGIRMALGSTPAVMRRLVLHEALLLAAWGIAVGGIASLWLTRFLVAMLYEVKPINPVALGLAGFALLLVTMLASSIPAYRAARVDPASALRYE